jgi:hypothetical protein
VSSSAEADSLALQACLARLDAALLDADAILSTDLGGQHEHTTVRLWRGQVLVDWEPDARAGGCLLRAALLRRLVALDARVSFVGEDLFVEASGRIVAALSPEHAALVRQLGGARRVQLSTRLHFVQGAYRGGEETYYLAERGRRIPLVRVTADVSLRSDRAGSRRTSRAPM